MKKYYLFVIKPDVYNIYHKNPSVLYEALSNLYRLEAYDFSYGISLFNQLCKPFSVKLLNSYIKEKYKYNLLKNNIIYMKSFVEKTFIQIGYASTVIFTDTSYPEIFRIFNIYNRKIFVCDFLNSNYFWLNKEVEKIGKKTS